MIMTWNKYISQCLVLWSLLASSSKFQWYHKYGKVNQCSRMIEWFVSFGKTRFRFPWSAGWSSIKIISCMSGSISPDKRCHDDIGLALDGLLQHCFLYIDIDFCPGNEQIIYICIMNHNEPSLAVFAHFSSPSLWSFLNDTLCHELTKWSNTPSAQVIP